MNLFEITQSTSKYEGVSWNKNKNLWQVSFYLNGKKQKSYFGNEFDAAKTLNTICYTRRILPQNPEVCEIQNQKVTNIQSKSFLVTLLHFVIQGCR